MKAIKHTFEVRVEKNDSSSHEFVTTGSSVDEVIGRFKSKYPDSKVSINNNRIFKLSDDWQP